MCPCLLDGIGDVEAQTAAQIHRVGLGIRYIGHHVNGGVVRTLHRGGPGQLLRQSGDGLILCHAANVDAVDGGAVAQRITAAEGAQRTVERQQHGAQHGDQDQGAGALLFLLGWPRRMVGMVCLLCGLRCQSGCHKCFLSFVDLSAVGTAVFVRTGRIGHVLKL